MSILSVIAGIDISLIASAHHMASMAFLISPCLPSELQLGCIQGRLTTLQFALVVGSSVKREAPSCNLRPQLTRQDFMQPTTENLGLHISTARRTYLRIARAFHLLQTRPHRQQHRHHVGISGDSAHAQVHPQPAPRPQADGRVRNPPRSRFTQSVMQQLGAMRRAARLIRVFLFLQ